MSHAAYADRLYIQKAGSGWAHLGGCEILVDIVLVKSCRESTTAEMHRLHGAAVGKRLIFLPSCEVILMPATI